MEIGIEANDLKMHCRPLGTKEIELYMEQNTYIEC